MKKRVFIVAGEASGDLHGGNLVQSMSAMDDSVFFQGVGGWHMRQAGVRLLCDVASMGVVGLSEVARQLIIICKVFQKSVNVLRSWRPDLLILIDYPDFNLLLARKARRLGIRVMYYISPQVWAWRSGRIKTIRRLVDKMVVTLPFEELMYRQAGVNASFVGHPLLDVVAVRAPEDLSRSPCLNPGEDRLVGLLPGSRQGELRALLPVMLDAAEILLARVPGIRFLMPLASTVGPEQVDPYLQGRKLPVTIIERNTHEVMQACEVIVAASGTVTLEAAILGTPMVVIYKLHPLTFWLARRLIEVEHVALANIVAGERVAPELLQEEANAERVAREVRAILEDPRRKAWIKERLSRVRERLGTPGASARAAAIALELAAGMDLAYGCSEPGER